MLADPRFTRRLTAPDAARLSAEGGGVFSEDAFGSAAEMDLTRSPDPHLAFGSGSRSCLGQALARTELQVVLEVLLRRLPDLEPAVPAAELERVEGPAVGGLRTVPVRW